MFIIWLAWRMWWNQTEGVGDDETEILLAGVYSERERGPRIPAPFFKSDRNYNVLFNEQNGSREEG